MEMNEQQVEQRIARYHKLVTRLTEKVGALTAQLEESNMILEEYAELAQQLKAKLDESESAPEVVTPEVVDENGYVI